MGSRFAPFASADDAKRNASFAKNQLGLAEQALEEAKKAVKAAEAEVAGWRNEADEAEANLARAVSWEAISAEPKLIARLGELTTNWTPMRPGDHLLVELVDQVWERGGEVTCCDRRLAEAAAEWCREQLLGAEAWVGVDFGAGADRETTCLVEVGQPPAALEFHQLYGNQPQTKAS